MEAMWTRFLPAVQAMKSLVASGYIGDIVQVDGDFSLPYAEDASTSRFDPKKGGGALAYLGVYPISLAHWLLGSPRVIKSVARRGSTGVDLAVSASLIFESGTIAAITTNLMTSGRNTFRVTGTAGAIELVGPVFRPYGLRYTCFKPRNAKQNLSSNQFLSKMRENNMVQKLAQVHGLLRSKGSLKKYFYSGNGYHYQVDEVSRCMQAGLRESSVMPIEESVGIVSTIESIKATAAF
jgi:predicted dehydrogenase